MTAREAMRGALGDFYRQSWRLFPLNAALALAAGAVLAAASFWRPALLGLVLLGPAAAALMHCAVVLVRTEDLRLADARAGLRLHARRGLALGAAAAALAALGGHAIVFYGSRSGAGIAAAFLSAYVLLLAALYLLLLLAVAVAEPELPLADAASRALGLAVARPGPTLGLGAGLALVNLAGLAAAAMPFLTLTVAYSFLAAARFATTEDAH